MKTKQNISVHIPVTMLNSTWKGDFNLLPPNKMYELTIDYPLSNPVKYKIATGKNGMGLTQLLGKIGNLYQKTYDREDSSESSIYGIYGHDIDDLNLSGLSINHDKLTIKLDVDS